MSNFKKAKGCEIIILKAGESSYDSLKTVFQNKAIAIRYGHTEFSSQRKLALHLGVSDSSIVRYAKKGHHKGVKITRVKETNK